jgi:2-iminobutanoate/2-iminopropanoate deaminase
MCTKGDIRCGFTYEALAVEAAARGSPARIFVCVPEWFGQFDIEIDCIAMI